MFSLAEIHPVIVHFPIVFFLSLVAFDTVTAVRGAPLAGRTSTGNISTGLALLAGLSAVVAFAFGDLAYDIARSAGYNETQLEIHEELGTWTAILLATWAVVRAYIWWRGAALVNRVRLAVLGIEFGGAALIITTAYFGGYLVYDLGVNVARASVG